MLFRSHTAADLARAAFEGVAFDVARCIEATGTAPESLALAGGAHLSPWAEIVAATVGVPGVVRTGREPASVGAAMLTARALGRPWDVDVVNPVTGIVEPPPGLVEAYAAVRARSDATAAAALGRAKG